MRERGRAVRGRLNDAPIVRCVRGGRGLSDWQKRSPRVRRVSKGGYSAS